MGVYVELPRLDEKMFRLPFSVGKLNGYLSVNTEMLIVQSLSPSHQVDDVHGTHEETST